MVNKKTDDMNETNKTTKKTVRRKTTKKKDTSAKTGPDGKKNVGNWPCSTYSNSCKRGRRRAA
mgnify:CR=1 FL=1